MGLKLKDAQEIKNSFMAGVSVRVGVELRFEYSCKVRVIIRNKFRVRVRIRILGLGFNLDRILIKSGSKLSML